MMATTMQNINAQSALEEEATAQAIPEVHERTKAKLKEVVQVLDQRRAPGSADLLIHRRLRDFEEAQVLERETQINNSTASVRVSATLEGLQRYYWQTDSGYWNACGQTGGQGGADNYHCLCVQSRCLNCYRWWTGHGLEALANYQNLTNANSSVHSEMISSAHTHTPFTALAYPMWAYVDDYMWWILAATRLHDIIGSDSPWLGEAIETFEYLWTRAQDMVCGGIFWLWPNNDTKNAITTLEAVAAAARIASHLPEGNETRRLMIKRAESLIDWFDDVGLVGDEGLVIDGVVSLNDPTVSLCCNGTSSFFTRAQCKAEGNAWSYNQGMYVGGVTSLFAVNNDSTLVWKAVRVLNATMDKLTVGGVLAEREGDLWAKSRKCDSKNDPAGDYPDRYSFKGVFMMQLVYFLQNTHQMLPRTFLARVVKFIVDNSNAAWATRHQYPFPLTDVCSAQSSTLATTTTPPPKFRWFWHDVKTEGRELECFDARTQLSALNVFLAHLYVENAFPEFVV